MEKIRFSSTTESARSRGGPTKGEVGQPSYVTPAQRSPFPSPPRAPAPRSPGADAQIPAGTGRPSIPPKPIAVPAPAQRSTNPRDIQHTRRLRRRWIRGFGRGSQLSPGGGASGLCPVLAENCCWDLRLAVCLGWDLRTMVHRSQGPIRAAMVRKPIRAAMVRTPAHTVPWPLNQKQPSPSTSWPKIYLRLDQLTSSAGCRGAMSPTCGRARRGRARTGGDGWRRWEKRDVRE